MKKFLFFAIAVFFINVLFAQGNKSFFFELRGNGILFSVNYDARFTKNENGFGFRAGIGIVPGSGSDNDFFTTTSFLTVPLGINYLLGRGPSYLELGAGATYVSGSVSLFGSDNEKASGVGFVPSIGYRYAKLGKGFQGRAFISPIIGSGGGVFWGGISIGYKF